MGNSSTKGVILGPEFGRQPLDEEILILYKLQTKLYTRLVESPEHINLLERYWKIMRNNNRNSHDNNANDEEEYCAFSRISKEWTQIGFSSDNPGQDLRPTGELGLECIVFFVENFPVEAKMIIRHFGYPFAKAVVAILHVLAEIFHLIEADATKGKYPVVGTLYWQILKKDVDFYLLFSLCVLLFDELYCKAIRNTISLTKPEEFKDYLLLTQVADSGKEILLNALEQAPRDLLDLQSICFNGRILLREENEVIRSTFRDSFMNKICSKSIFSKKKSSLSRKLSSNQRDGNQTEEDDLFVGLHLKSAS